MQMTVKKKRRSNTAVGTDRYFLLTDYLDLSAATGVDDARWEHFQLAHLCDDSPFRIEDKSRQIAWSWLSAAEAVANAVLDAQPSIFVSINQDEASEKIRYAKAVLENLHAPFPLPKIKRDNTLMLEFDNGARLISLPSREPRGKARFNVYLDEFCHLQRDRAIYSAALPIISKGGKLRIGSSLMSPSGQHWEISQQKLRAYPHFSRSVTPWWKVMAFCTDVRTAFVTAPRLTTAERVARFGNERIQTLHDNMPEEDFQREFECIYVDEGAAWITWDEIAALQGHDLAFYKAHGRDGHIDEALRLIDLVAGLCHGGQLEKVLAAGVDIGRTRDTTELFFVGASTTNTFPLRMAITLENMPYDRQLEVIYRALEMLPIKKMLIDKNGIGNNLAEAAAKKYPTKAEGVAFTMQSKTLWATDAKQLVQQGRTPLPNDRDISYQIHSIKRSVTSAKNMVFDTERNEKHHADKFWAWVLALAGANIKIKVPLILR